MIKPIVKWAGGKTQLLPHIVKQLPKEMGHYVEAFAGGASVLLHLQPETATLNDANFELINTYRVVRDNLESLLVSLSNHKNTPDHFYTTRGVDRTGELQDMSDVERASRMLYLNKTCFNGLYRLNKSGYFNTPFGEYAKPNISNEATLRAVSAYLNINNVRLLCGDYSEVLSRLDSDCFVYLDPPYHGCGFTSYTAGGWDLFEHKRLNEACNDLTRRGVKFLMSNSSTIFVKHLYRDYQQTTVKANRNISSSKKRAKVEELLIQNY